MLKPGVNLNRIQLFLEIVKVGSISKTAELFNLQKSKVSRDLGLLEQELGTQLVYRTTRQFNLTVEGQKFYDKANSSIQTLLDAVSEVSFEAKTIAGHISMTSPADIGELILIPLLDEFSKLYPKITYKIDLSADIKDLVAEKIDMAIRPGRLKDSSLKIKKVGQIEFGLYCSSALYDSMSDLKAPKQLTDMPTIFFQSGTKTPKWELFSDGTKYQISLNPVVQVNSYIAALKLVQKGMGIGLLPKFIVNSDSRKSEVVQILKKFTTILIDVQLIYPNANADLARVRVLSDFLTKRMKAIF